MLLVIITAIVLAAIFGCIFGIAFTDDRRKRIALAWWIGAIGGSLALLHWVISIL